ncbi:MAG: Rrf2 family transcriptional regulator [Methylococcales bacterium]|nr:Rrf2 family transcriptional regulator [Methylococcales bacterium]
MQLTLHTDYALRVLIYLAMHPGQRVTITDLSSFFKISRNHLVKVVHELGLKGFVHSVRGKNGGLSLSKPADQIRVGEVVRAMEVHFHIVECFNPQKQGVCPIQPQCSLTALLGRANEQFLRELDEAFLSDVLLRG